MSTFNVKDAFVDGRDAVSFDWIGPGVSPDGIHALAFVLKDKYVFVIDWFGYACYAPVVRDAEQAMIASFRET
jgi:hypothetical protein